MLEIELPEGLRNAGAADWRQLGAITGEAFETDPVNMWIFGNERALAPTFGILAQVLYLKYGICHLAQDGGAAMWVEFGKRKELGAWPTLRIVTNLLRRGSQGSVVRALRAGNAMDANHPKEPHLYLFTIGTRKANRGKGLGRMMMTPMTTAADRARLPCYLENSNPQNTGFYHSHGFERLKLFEVGPGSPPLEAMWREPRGAV